MSLSQLPLSYCTNVHPGRSLEEVEQGLDCYTLPVRQRLGAPLAAGLWLARPVIGELLEAPDRLAGFAERLRGRELVCHTLNAFPYGDFHSPRVKEQVYLPDWTDLRRQEYTLGCARVLARLLDEQTEGSISTVPLGFKGFAQPDDFLERCAARLIETAGRLAELHDETGKLIRLAIEPEPCCVLETTPETLAFFEKLRAGAAAQGRLEAAQRHLGVCYDVCHQSVEFEDVAESISALDAAGVRINKVHITCAIQADRPADSSEVRAALARYVEPRYLHQTFARSADGRIVRALDLTESLAFDPGSDFRAADTWRVHFHVPVNADRLGPLATTRPDLQRALAAVARLDYAPHLEVETYTWEVLPTGGAEVGLVDGLTAELQATQQLLQSL